MPTKRAKNSHSPSRGPSHEYQRRGEEDKGKVLRSSKRHRRQSRKRKSSEHSRSYSRGSHKGREEKHPRSRSKCFSSAYGYQDHHKSGSPKNWWEHQPPYVRRLGRRSSPPNSPEEEDFGNSVQMRMRLRRMPTSAGFMPRGRSSRHGFMYSHIPPTPEALLMRGFPAEGPGLAGLIPPADEYMPYMPEDVGTEQWRRKHEPFAASRGRYYRKACNRYPLDATASSVDSASGYNSSTGDQTSSNSDTPRGRHKERRRRKTFKPAEAANHALDPDPTFSYRTVNRNLATSTRDKHKLADSVSLQRTDHRERKEADDEDEILLFQIEEELASSTVNGCIPFVYPFIIPEAAGKEIYNQVMASVDPM